jgi:hypothetical protein
MGLGQNRWWLGAGVDTGEPPRGGLARHKSPRIGGGNAMTLVIGPGDFDPDSEVGRVASTIAEHDLFAGLPWESIDNLVPAFRVEEFQHGEIDCHCPDALHDAFLVLEGQIALTDRVGGLEHVLELGGFGTVFNLDGLLGLKESHRTARALGRVKLVVMDTKLLDREFDRDPGTGYKIIRYFAKLLVVQHDKELEHWLA